MSGNDAAGESAGQITDQYGRPIEVVVTPEGAYARPTGPAQSLDPDNKPASINVGGDQAGAPGGNSVKKAQIQPAQGSPPTKYNTVGKVINQTQPWYKQIWTGIVNSSDIWDDNWTPPKSDLEALGAGMALSAEAISTTRFGGDGAALDNVKIGKISRVVPGQKVSQPKAGASPAAQPGGSAQAAKGQSGGYNTPQSGAAKLSPKAQSILGKLAGSENKTVSQAIRDRGGKAANVAELQTGMGQLTVGEAATRAAEGDSEALKAIKMIKQADQKGQRY